MKLVKPTLAHEALLKNYVEEMNQNKDTCHGCESIEDYINYRDWLAHIASYAVKKRSLKGLSMLKAHSIYC